MCYKLDRLCWLPQELNDIHPLHMVHRELLFYSQFLWTLPFRYLTETQSPHNSGGLPGTSQVIRHMYLKYVTNRSQTYVSTSIPSDSHTHLLSSVNFTLQVNKETTNFQKESTEQQKKHKQTNKGTTIKTGGKCKAWPIDTTCLWVKTSDRSKGIILSLSLLFLIQEKKQLISYKTSQNHVLPTNDILSEL